MKYMITITKILEDNTYQTLGLDICQGTVSVNCPKSTGIEVETVRRDSHFELVLKLPHIDQDLRFQCKNANISDVVNEVEFGAAFGVSGETYLVQ